MREKKKPKMIRDKTVNDEQDAAGHFKGKTAAGKKDLPSAAQHTGRDFKKSGGESSRSSSRQTRSK